MSDDTPRYFELEQNYPNPFNPVTTIGFRVPGAKTESGVSGPGSSHVRLVVYDMLGREVAVLVNEHKAAGFDEVKFDAAGLSSGVYFYRMSAGSFAGTKKLLLVR